MSAVAETVSIQEIERHGPFKTRLLWGLRSLKSLVARKAGGLFLLFLFIFLPVFVPSLVLLLLKQFAQLPLEALKVSQSSRWWSVFTYIFVHDNFDSFASNFEHFAGNMLLLVFYLIAAGLSQPFEMWDRWQRVLLLAIASFALAILVGVLHFLLSGPPASGASGFVYAVLGAIAGFGTTTAALLRDWKALPLSLILLFTGVLLVFVGGSYVLAHGVAFFGGLIVFTGYGVSESRRSTASRHRSL